MPIQNDSQVAPAAQEPGEFAHVLNTTHAELLAVCKLLHETVAQLAVVQEALSTALEPPSAPDHAGQLITEMREVRARMLQKFVR